MLTNVEEIAGNSVFSALGTYATNACGMTQMNLGIGLAFGTLARTIEIVTNSIFKHLGIQKYNANINTLIGYVSCFGSLAATAALFSHYGIAFSFTQAIALDATTKFCRISAKAMSGKLPKEVRENSHFNKFFVSSPLWNRVEREESLSTWARSSDKVDMLDHLERIAGNSALLSLTTYATNACGMICMNLSTGLAFGALARIIQIVTNSIFDHLGIKSNSSNTNVFITRVRYLGSLAASAALLTHYGIAFSFTQAIALDTVKNISFHTIARVIKDALPSKIRENAHLNQLLA